MVSHVHGHIFMPLLLAGLVFMLHYQKNITTFDSSSGGPIVLKASSLIVAYSPLSIRQGGDGKHFSGYFFDLALAETDKQLVKLDKIYLVPGMHLDDVLLGGPEKWNNGVDFAETMEILNEQHGHIDNGASVEMLSESYKSLYRVSCQMQGTYKIVFKRGNLVGDGHPLPAVAEVPLSPICSIPASIIMVNGHSTVNEREVRRTAIQADCSSGRIRGTPVIVANGRTIRLAAIGISISGEAFANSSSLYLRWELISCNEMANWDDADNLERSEHGWERLTKFMSRALTQEVRPHQLNLFLDAYDVKCTVRATTIGFRDNMGGHKSVPLLDSSENVLADGIQLVSTLMVSPEFNLVFFDPNAKVNYKAKGFQRTRQLIKLLALLPPMTVNNSLLSSLPLTKLTAKF
ncbi:unnamed protein product [Prunus armeniaca]|uniref:NUP210 Ig-like domain-containing protein n=1 Tax=Prunus armeniaca TaxID=36596 RepID=A0A6J5UJA0_PRUAR|nr:unnamed protein product [Prunus armeniaca]CAB4305722.1 unnamed protein product [Prunus armeniaca]